MHTFAPTVARVLVDDRLRSARHHALVASVHPSPARPAPAVTIRRSRAQDALALQRLAELDSAAPLHSPVLVAEADGVLRAAMSLADGAVVADPFFATTSIRELLGKRAEQLQSVVTLRRFAGWPSRASHRARVSSSA